MSLNSAEEKDIYKLIKYVIKLLKSVWHKYITILLRDKDHLGKSVQHLHYHVIPNVEIAYSSQDREVLSKNQIKNLTKKLKKYATK